MDLITAHEHDEEDPIMRLPCDMTTWSEGVEEHKKKTTEELARALGLHATELPFFNTKQDPIGELDPWSEAGQAALEHESATPLAPKWHQWVGILKMMDNMFDGKNILVMDEVGVGKSLQAVGAIAMYEYQRLYYKSSGLHAPRFGEAYLELHEHTF